MTIINILSLLVEDHKKIEKLIEQFKQDKNNFSALNDAMIKHFREEEKLYSAYLSTTNKTLPIIQTITKEHEILANNLKQAQYSSDISEFEALVQRHKNMEERLLYPELDKELSENQKENAYWGMTR